MAGQERVWREEIRVKGEELVGQVRQLIHEGNVRRIIIKNDRGQTVIEVPLTIGVVGALVAPVWAAIGALAALAANWKVVVERREVPSAKKPAGGTGGSARKPAGKKTAARKTTTKKPSPRKPAGGGRT